MANYQFLDANSSILTAAAVDVGGVLQPIVQVSSVYAVVSGQSSVSGTVGASIIGQLPAGTALLGSVATLQGTNPWNIAGSVLSIPGGNQSVSGTVGASLIGMLPEGTRVIGSVATLQGTNPWNIIGSVSGTIGASIIGQLPAGTAVLGSVMVLQGTNPWNVSSVYGNISGSVLSQQLGTRVSSVLNSIPSSLLTGVHGQRNDAIASALGGDLSWRPLATDSAGRPLTKPYAPEESRVEGYIALTSTSLTTLVAAAGAGLRNYITDLWFANTGATTTLVTLSDSAGSILGYTIAPTVSGSNLPGLVTPIRTGANAAFNIQAGSNTSTLYATVKGFKAP